MGKKPEPPRAPVPKMESINEQSKKVQNLATANRAPVVSYRDRRQLKKATEIVEKRSANEIMEAEIKKLEEEKVNTQQKKKITMLF